MTLNEALNWGAIPRSERRLLLGEILQKTHAYLAAHDEVELSVAEEERFRREVSRRELGEPMAYILGWKEFYGRSFRVTPAVLIPRPETETLVDWVLTLHDQKSPLDILDLGCGSGALALTLAAEYPKSRVVAVDISPAALTVASDNRTALLDQTGRVELLQGSWFAPLAARQFDLIVSNPPYVACQDPHLQEGDVRFEPMGALAAGEDGLSDLRQVIGEAPTHLRSGGWLLVEHGYDQESAVSQLFGRAGFQGITCHRDLAEIPRITGGFLP